MLENRASYGWGGTSTGVLSKEQQQKWEICYRNEYGWFGIIGWKLYDTEAEALSAGQKFKADENWTEFWVRHPSKYYSNY